MIAKVTKDEAEKLAELRKTIPELNDEKFDDGFLLKWLRVSNDSDLKKVECALKQHLIFRKAWEIDGLNDWIPPEACAFYSYGYPCNDKEGSPVLLSPFASIDVVGLMKCISSVDYIRNSFKHIEQGLNLAKESAKKKGIPYEQMVMVMDLTGLSLAHYTHKPFTNSYLTMLSLFQENYPLAFKRIVVINAPSVAQYAYGLLKPFLSENIQNMVEMPGDDWQLKLFETVDPENWPAFWGGKMKDSDGNEKCPSKMRFFDGQIPESYYVEDTMENCDHVTVYAGDKHLIELEVTSENSELQWKFRTTGEDIGFSVNFDKFGDKNDMQQIFPYARLECTLVPAKGTLKCAKKGKYVVEFDNHYSWFSSKDLIFSLKIANNLQ